jgi:RNA polymerase sigma factor (sigma-70 family)
MCRDLRKMRRDEVLYARQKPYRSNFPAHFQVIARLEESRVDPSRAAGVARDGRNKTNGSNGSGWVYNRYWPGSPKEILAKYAPDYTDTLPSFPDSSRNPEALVGQNELSDAVRECLDDLPMNQRLAITLRHYDGMSYDEIAGVLDVSAKAVDSLLQRARDTLRQRLQTYR